MNIRQQLELLESLAEQDIKKLSPKDRLSYYNSLKEFDIPKLQRSPYQTEAELPDSITIEVITHADKSN